VAFGFLKRDKKDSLSSLPPVPVAVGAFGKVPQMGDFVRVGAKPLPAFEQWVEAGMAAGEKKHGAAWPAVYGAGAIHAFAYRPPASSRDGAVLVGVLKPSHDSVGRKFPLVVFAQIPEQRAAVMPHVLPLLLGDFLEAATEAVLQVEGITSASQYQERIQRIAPPVLDGDRASYEYDSWARGTYVSVAWGAIYGDSESESGLVALRSIREAIAPFVDQENPTTPLSLRLPLGSGGVAAAAFWLDVTRRVARWRSTMPTSFWSFDGHAGTVLIQLGSTPPSSFVELWKPDPDSDSVCNLVEATTMDQRAQLLAAFPRDLGARLSRGDAMVEDILELLAR
jgi:type VI secretion system protein ImpM